MRSYLLGSNQSMIKEQLNLSTEDAKLLEDLYESFKANGATLNKDDKEKYRKLSMDLSMLTLQFDQNALKDKTGSNY